VLEQGVVGNLPNVAVRVACGGALGSSHVCTATTNPVFGQVVEVRTDLPLDRSLWPPISIQLLDHPFVSSGSSGRSGNFYDQDEAPAMVKTHRHRQRQHENAAENLTEILATAEISGNSVPYRWIGMPVWMKCRSTNQRTRILLSWECAAPPDKQDNADGRDAGKSGGIGSLVLGESDDQASSSEQQSRSREGDDLEQLESSSSGAKFDWTKLHEHPERHLWAGTLRCKVRLFVLGIRLHGTDLGSSSTSFASSSTGANNTNTNTLLPYLEIRQSSTNALVARSPVANLSSTSGR
ncbi:unnamed protein product, partial [Amoebophrya sp. A25]